MPPTVLGLKISMLGEKVRDLHLDGLAQKGARPIAQDLGEPVGEGSWLNQLDDVIVRHGVSLHSFAGEVAGLNHRHDTPPYPFTPSPTSRHGSASRAGNHCGAIG